MTQFIAFLDFGLTGIEEEDRVPIATGKTREEAMQRGIPRMLEILGGSVMSMVHGSLAVVSQPDLTADEFARVDHLIEDFFAKRAVA